MKLELIDNAEKDILDVLRLHPKMAEYVQNDRDLQSLINYSASIRCMLEKSDAIVWKSLFT